jgi:hypothetical protein
MIKTHFPGSFNMRMKLYADAVQRLPGEGQYIIGHQKEDSIVET